MFIRMVRNGSGKQYYQLVESYRREKDGMPAHRVITSLNHLSDVEIANLKAALAAGRKGHRVGVVEDAKLAPQGIVRRNLDYLPHAVLLELWREWGIDEVLEDVMPTQEAEIAPADVVAALSVQRCVAPGSKLNAQQWFPTTALPEMLGVAPAQFNNTRIHRVLERLEQTEDALQARLPELYQQREGAFATLFLDSTDTFFVGQGPELATKGKTKEGRYERKIGILLVCNEHGYPLRWRVVEGKQNDTRSFQTMLEELSQTAWAAQTPIVVDRAMGTTKPIETMYATGLRFVTALCAGEFDNYVRLPRLEGVEVTLEADRVADDLAVLTRAIEDTDFEKVSDTLFVKDFGLKKGEQGPASPPPDADIPLAVEALELACQIEEKLRLGTFGSIRDAARSLGRSKQWVHSRMTLLRLADTIQSDLRDRQPDVSMRGLLEVAQLSVEQQHAAYDELIASGRSSRRTKPGRPTRRAQHAALDVRCIAYFNPHLALQKRKNLQDKIDEIYGLARELNAKLDENRTSLSPEELLGKLTQKLSKLSLKDAFDVSLGNEEEGSRLRLAPRPEALERRRRRYGFSVVIAHPDLVQSAAELAKLYRARHAIEHDFRVIKSVVQLRPIYHQTETKVRAHVSICMLALLLERTLARRLKKLPYSPETALEILDSCHLNVLDVEAAKLPVYTVTKPSADEKTILKSLKMEHLTDDESVRQRITER